MLNGEFGFLCRHTQLCSQYIEINEKEEWKKQNYDEFSKKYNGFMPEFRAPRRIYNCPLNYTINADFCSLDHLTFTVYGLSMLYGVKLVPTPYSYIDNTCIRTFHLGYTPFSKEDEIFFCDNLFQFYNINKNSNRVEIIKNTIYLLFRMETKYNFLYEIFLFAYTAIDGCFNFYCDKYKPSKFKINFLCNMVNIDYEEHKELICFIVDVRNQMIHEGTFLGSMFAHKIKKEIQDKFLHYGVQIFFKSLIIRLIFKMLNIDIDGFISPLSLNETSIYIKK